MKKAIVLDIDDTISDFIGNLLHVHNSIYNTKYDRSVFVNWAMPEDVRQTFKDFEHELYVSQPILPKVKKKLKAMKRKGYQIIFMTARDDTFRKPTIFNLAFNGIEYDAIFFNKNKALKINRLMKKYDIEIFADDKLETVNNVAKKTKIPKVYLITRAYNRSLREDTRVKRIYNIADIEL